MIYVFDAYEFNTNRRALCRAGTPVRLEPKVFDLLAYLIQHHDHFVSREELYARLWPEQFVSESALTYCIAEARKAVGDTGRAQRVIKTVHGRGYRFIAHVEQHLPASAPEEAATVPTPLPEAERLSPHQADMVPLTSTDEGEPAFARQHAEATESAWPAQGTLEAERRQLTVLWCRRVVTSVDSGPLDPEELHPVIHDVQRVCDQIIQRFEGWMAQHFGDGFVVYFGHPRAHEDDARRAVHTALEMVRNITRLSQELQHQHGMEFAVHVGKALPAEIQQQLVAKTNGVPLFVEEMTKMVLELGLVKEKDGHYELTGPSPTLTISSTLHDSLMARLDRQGIGKPVAQLGATLGREFSYEVIQAISSLDETLLQQGLSQLVNAEILYQRGLPPQAQYIFKHALIQEAAYQSLLRRTRRQYHTQIAQVLEEHFPETCASQPELVAHHYTEAGLSAPALVYWQRAGQRALERSAYVEALAHLRQGLTLTATLPDTPERLQHELTLSMALGAALMATQGFAALEVEHAYIRARECARQVGDLSQLFTALRGLWLMYLVRGEVQMAYEQGAHLLHLAQRQLEPPLLIEAHRAVGVSLCFLGELTAALSHLEQGLALYDASQHRALILRYVQDPGMVCLVYAAWILWWRGYPDQALHHVNEALALAQQCQHPFCQTFALTFAVILHQCRREVQAVSTYVEAGLSLAQQYGFPLFVTMGGIFRNWVLAEYRPEDGRVEQIRAGVAAYRATGAELYRPYFLGLLAEAYGNRGRADTGLETLTEALALVETTGERLYEAELYRLKGHLLLVRSLDHRTEAEVCFHHALAIARRQQARLLELRATISLSRLWQQQGKGDQARHMLGEVYGWFTEGFDTADLMEAKALLDALR